MSTQKQIIEELGVRADQGDIESIIRERVDFLKDYLTKSKCTSYVLGISGGVDSLTAGLLAQQAVNELKDDGYVCKFIAVKLPYAFQADAKFVEAALNTIKPDAIEYCNIQEMTTAVERGCDDVLTKHDDSSRDFIRGNIKARSRMVAQYAIANAENGLVIGTDHSAEAVSGFFTKHGDGACDIIPLSGLVKGTVRKIAKQYGASPELYEKVATADLEDLKVNLPDEVALGVSYDDIDAFLMGEQVAKDVEYKIIQRYIATQHKRELPVAHSTLYNESYPTVQFKTYNLPKELVDFLSEVKDYATKYHRSFNDVIDDSDAVASIFNTMESYYGYVDEIWHWYYNIPFSDIINFAETDGEFSLVYGTPITLDSNASQQINKTLDLINRNYFEDKTVTEHLTYPKLQTL